MQQAKNIPTDILVGEFFLETIVICRICLECKNEEAKNIHEYCIDGITLVQKMLDCASVSEVTKDDGLPQHICSSCLFLLENAYKFKQLCESSNIKLRSSKKSTKEQFEEYVLGDIPIEECKDDEVVNNRSSKEDEDENIWQNDENLERNSDVIFAIEVDVNKNRAQTINIPQYSEEINQCEACRIIYQSKIELKKHIKNHMCEKPFLCETCCKEFKTKLSLKIHIRTHTGERPHICETCGKAFKTWSALATHRATHSLEKTFVCHDCPYRANTKSNLEIHNRIHTGVQSYACDKCPLRFRTASNRIKHIKNIHEKLKMHKCENCGREFFSRESARKHMVIHTGLRPYTCIYCKMAYSWYNGLIKHMKSNHAGKKIPTEKYYLDIEKNKIEKKTNNKKVNIGGIITSESARNNRKKVSHTPT